MINWKSPIVLTALVVGALFLAAAAGYALRNQPSEAVPVAQQETAAIDASNWQTYENTELGFNFKFPKEYGPVESIIKNTVFIPYDNEGLSKGITIISYRNPVDSAVDQIAEYNGYQRQTDQTVGGEIWQSFSYDPSRDPDATDQAPSRRYVYQSSNEVIQLIFNLTGIELNTIQAILSTFEFTDQTSLDTSTWQTYENSVWKFGFKFPAGWKIDDKLPKIFTKEVERLGQRLDVLGLNGESLTIHTNPGGFGQEDATYFYSGAITDGKVTIKNKEKGQTGVEQSKVDPQYIPYVSIDLGQNSDVTYFLSYGYPSTSPEADQLKLLDQILSTFQFTALR